MFSEEKLDEVLNYLEARDHKLNVYIATDSNRYQNRKKIWMASYSTVVVVHNLNELGRNCGSKIFYETTSIQDYDQDKSRPFLRMMNEAYRTSEVYDQLRVHLRKANVELHLDINPDPLCGSNVAYNSAVGLLKGVAYEDNVVVKTKPDAWAASHAADHAVREKL